MRATQHWAVPPASTADTAQNTSNTPVLAAVFADDKLIVAAGTTPLVYAVDTGELLATLSGHKDTVNCVCSMLGGGFASGGKDCLVILWNASLQGILKYSHSDQIQALAQNQTGTLLSCTMSDFGLWSPNVKAVQKTRVNAKIVSCAWTDDGLYFALGMYNGAVSIRTVSGIEHASIQRNAPVWALAWTPSTESAQMLAVTDWDQTFQLYAVSGQPVGKQRRLGYDPCTIQPFKEYFLMGGSNRHLHLWTAQGTCISQLCDRPGWVWACAGHPIKNLIAVASQDGSVTMFQFEMMHEYSLYKETYAFRHSLTDVRIQNLTNDQTTVIKCRDFIKNISIYKDRLAVCLPERTVIYDLFHDDENNMHFRIKDKLIGLPECTFMHVFANNLVQTHEKSVCLYNMLGEKEREWILDSPLTTTRVLGGPRGRESFLVALQNGDIYKIFVDSAFPVPILSHPTLVSQVDINLLRTKLAIVDDKHVCSVYDIATKELLYQEHDVDSVAWNSLIDDMLCFSGKDSYTVKSGRYTTPSQSTTGRIAGFKASQVYILNKHGMAVSDISPTPLVTRYAQDGDFDTAYRIASIGMSQSDWSRLAKSAFEHLRFEIARKCYARTNDFKMLENIRHLEKLKVQYTSEPDMLMAHVYMLTAKYQEAAKLMKRCGEAQKAVEMLTELNLWDQATALAAESRISTDMILKRKAQVQQSQNDTMAAANTYEQIGDFSKAIDLLISAQKPELLLAICAKMDHKHTSEFAKCISYFKKNQNVEYAIEAIEKLGDNAQLVKFLVDLKRWDEAFKVCETRPEYQAAIYLPYGYWLASNDRFDDAQAFFLKAGRADEAMRVMNQLLKVALGQECFDDVAFYYWSLAKSIFSEIHTQSPQLSEQDALKLEEAREYADLAELYHSYHKVYKYVQDPFTFSSLEHLFNISKFLIVKLEYRPVPPGISRAYILHTLAKVSKSLKCYRICRFALEKLQALNIPREWQQVVDLSTALIKATPETDSAHMNFNCFQCGYINQPFKAKLDSCSNCLEPFVRSLNMFEPLPLIEFVAAAGIAHNEAIKLINTISSTQAVYKDEALQLQLVLGERQSGYTPIVYDRQALLLLEPHKVMIRNTLKSLTPKFYQLVNSDVRVKQCRSCEYLFSEDEWNYQILIDAKCSFCRAECPAE